MSDDLRRCPECGQSVFDEEDAARVVEAIMNPSSARAVEIILVARRGRLYVAKDRYGSPRGVTLGEAVDLLREAMSP